MAGFCRAMREESGQNSEEAMLDYLISLLDDSNYFSWASTKANHTVLLCRMEQGEISDYTQTEQIYRVRHAHAQRHVTNSQDFVMNGSKLNNTKSMVCHYYNSGTCPQESTLETKGSYTQACVFFLFHKEW